MSFNQGFIEYENINTELDQIWKFAQTLNSNTTTLD